MADEPNMDANRAYLNIKLNEDFIVVVSVALAAFHFLSVFVLVGALNHAMAPIFTGKRLPADTRKTLRALYGLPRRLVIRRSDRADCYVVSSLGVSVLLISKEVLANPDTPDAKMKISHELGHLGRADLVFTEMLSNAALMGLMIVAYGAGLDLTGALPFPDTAAAYALIALYLFVFGVGTYHIKRFHFTREFLADSHAMANDPEGYGAFLRGRATRERYTRPRFRFLSSINPLSHPSFAERVRFQQEGYRTEEWREGRSAALTAGVAVVSIYLCLIDYTAVLSLGNWWWEFFEREIRDFQSLAAYLAPTLGLIWVAGAAIYIALSIRRTRKLDRCRFRMWGYIAGAAGAATVCLLLDVAVLGQAGLTHL